MNPSCSSNPSGYGSLFIYLSRTLNWSWLLLLVYYVPSVCCSRVVFIIRLYCGSSLHAAAHELKRGVEPKSLLAGAPVAIGLYRNLQAAVERQLDASLVARMRIRTWPTEGQGPVDKLSKEFKHLMDEEDEEDEDQHMKDDKVLEETCSVRTRHRTKCRTPKSKCKKPERASWQ